MGVIVAVIKGVGDGVIVIFKLGVGDKLPVVGVGEGEVKFAEGVAEKEGKLLSPAAKT